MKTFDKIVILPTEGQWSLRTTRCIAPSFYDSRYKEYFFIGFTDGTLIIGATYTSQGLFMLHVATDEEREACYAEICEAKNGYLLIGYGSPLSLDNNPIFQRCRRRLWKGPRRVLISGWYSPQFGFDWDPSGCKTQEERQEWSAYRWAIEAIVKPYTQGKELDP